VAARRETPDTRLNEQPAAASRFGHLRGPRLPNVEKMLALGVPHKVAAGCRGVLKRF